MSLSLRMSKRSCVESTIICTITCVLLLIGLRPNSNYLPLNFLVLGAVLGGVYGWIIYLTVYYGTSEWGKASPIWYMTGGAVLGCLFGLHSISFWVFTCVGIFVCILCILSEKGHIKNAERLYVVLGAIFGSIIAIFAFYLLRGQAIVALGEEPLVVMPKDTGTIIILGTIVGVICGLIPGVNFVAALIFGLIISFNSQQLVYSLRKPFFLIPLFLLFAYIIANKIDKKYEHTKGSRVALVLLFVLVTTISLFVARMQGWDWGWSLVLAVPVWFLTSMALVQITAKLQKPEIERRKLWNELGKIESSLSKVEAEIRMLNEEKHRLRQKYEEPLKRRNQLEEEINRLVASDPANLMIKAEESRKQFQGTPIDKIREIQQKIDKDVGNINRTREEYQRQLKLFEKEREALYSRLHETERILQRLEMVDPKNVGIKLETLQRKWQGLTESELNVVKPFGEVERLFKEQCLLNLRIEAKNKEIETQHNKIRDSQRFEALSELEKLILEQEEITKSLGQDEPRLIKIDDELEKLKAEQPKLTKEKSRISQRLAEMQMAKPRLRVGKGFFMVVGAALAFSLLLNFLTYGYVFPVAPAEPRTYFYVLTQEGVVNVSPEGIKQTIIWTQEKTDSLEILGNKLYVSDKKRGGNILVYDLQGNFLRTIPIPSQASDYLEFVTLPDERIALLDNWNDKIYFINSLGNLLAIVNILDEPDSHLQNLDGIVVGNRLILSEDGKKHLLQINLNTYERSIFKDLSSLPHWLGAITYANGQFYLCGPQMIYSFTEGSYVTQIAEIPEGNIVGIVIVNNYAYVSVNFAGKIYKVDLDNGTTNVFVSDLDYPLDLEAILIQP